MFVPSTVEPFVVLLRDVLTAVSIPIHGFRGNSRVEYLERQMVGAATFDLSAPYYARCSEVNEINYHRSPFMSLRGNSYSSSRAGTVATKTLDKSNVQSGRVSKAVEKLLKGPCPRLEIAALEAEVVWGEDANKIITLMNKPVGSLSVSTNAYLRRPADR